MKYFLIIIERIIPLGFCGLIIFYYFTNKLVFFVNPIYELLILGSGIFICSFSIFPNSKHSHNQSANFAKTIQMFVLSCIIVFSFVYKPQPLSSSLAISRGLSQNLSGFQINAPLQFSKNSEDRTLVEWIQMLNINPEPDSYIGKKVHFNGFVIHDDSSNENYFYIGRFILACCAADARTIVLPVEYDSTTIDLPNDTWIDIRGHIVEQNKDGQRSIAIKMESFKIIPVPHNPYTY